MCKIYISNPVSNLLKTLNNNHLTNFVCRWPGLAPVHAQDPDLLQEEIAEEAGHVTETAEAEDASGRDRGINAEETKVAVKEVIDLRAKKKFGTENAKSGRKPRKLL